MSLPSDLYSTLFDVVEVRDEVAYRSLASAGRTYERKRLSLLYVKGKMVYDFLFLFPVLGGGVRVGDVLQLDVTFHVSDIHSVR